MSIPVPESLIKRFENILISMYGNSPGVKEYRWIIADLPDDAAKPDYDDSTWLTQKDARPYKRGQGVTWHRFKVTVPENIMGLSMLGSMVRLSHWFLAPTDVYIDGELRFSEYAWMDFKSPEVILTESYEKGQEFFVAVKLTLTEISFWNTGFGMSIVPEVWENAQFEISSFKDELIYASGFKEVEHVLPKVYEIMEKALSEHNIPAILDAISKCRKMLEPMREESKKRSVHLVGHAHIDISWFWPIEDTIDVIKRDFSTMCDILDQFPQFKFSQSQCVTYDITEKLFPHIFERMKKHIKEGRWDVTASTWTEGDLNMASGESITRHILYSKKYLKERFGVDPRIMWCPDTFGHSANVPQILAKSGIENYFFLRCGLDFDKGPHDSDEFIREAKHYPVFWWDGIDGSRVLAVNMLYGGDIKTKNLIDISQRMHSGFNCDRSMFVYGTGDHGGGPTKRDVKRLIELNEHPTTPTLEFSTTEEFYSQIHKNKDSLPLLPVKKGEMNFIFDGCYTTHADIKRDNRICENTLFAAEVVNTAALVNGGQYSYDVIEEAWKTTLFNQFHDIFDGSSVPSAYKYTREHVEKALSSLKDVTDKALTYIGSKMRAKREGIPVLCVNPTGWIRDDYVKIKKPNEKAQYKVYDGENNKLLSQVYGDSLIVYVKNIPAAGGKVIYLEEADASSAMETTQGTSIVDEGELYKVETSLYLIEIRKNSGEIVSMYDKLNNRYIVARAINCWRNKNGILNSLSVHNEEPTHMSSWNIGEVVSVKNLKNTAVSEIIADGPLVKLIRFNHEFMSSRLTQDMIIYNDNPRIDFATEVDWQEYGDYDKEAPMLRVSFSPDLHNPKAFYDIPYGSVERPTKDVELPALKWVDMTDGENGFALLNDCKHGYRVTGNVIEFALIRSGWLPDWKSDVGHHEFTYSILPHDGASKTEAVKEGGFLNNEIITAFIDPKGNNDDSFSLASPSVEHVALSAVKAAEDGSGIIIRVYDYFGDGGEVSIKTDIPFKKIVEVDLNENENGESPQVSNNSFNFNMGKYDIRSFKLII